MADREQYPVSLIVFEGAQKDLVLQDTPCCAYADQGCPCAFISILNWFTLTHPSGAASGYIKSALPGSLSAVCHGAVSGSALRQYAMARLDFQMSHLERNPQTASMVAEYGKGVTEVLRSLPTKLHLDVGLDSPSSFQITPGKLLFDYLGILLLHGRLVDPEDEKELYHAIEAEYVSDLIMECKDPDSPFPQLAQLSTFLESTEKTKITPYGLASLRREVQEGTHAILYANDHYRVLYNRQGTLFYLVTDKDVIAQLPQASWKSLEIVDEDGFFVTDKFLPVKGQTNMIKADQWYNEDIKESLRRLGEEKQTTRPAKKKKKKKKKKATEGQGRDAASANSQSSAGKKSALDDSSARSPSPAGRKGTPDGAIERSPSPSGRKDHKLVCGYFADFLQNFKIGGTTAPYFEGMVKLIRHLGVPVMQFPYAYLSEHNKIMAMYIQDHYESIQEILRQIVAEYLIDQGLHTDLKLEKADVRQGAVLKIIDLPQPKCTQTFEDFVSDNELCRDEWTSYIGRKMASGYLAHIIYWFKKGKCWGGGDWQKSDMEVRNNGMDFVITKDPEKDLEKNLAYLDLIQFILIVLEAFKSDTGAYPPYFDEFQVDVMQIPDPLKDSDRVADSLREGMDPRTAYAPFCNREGLKDWTLFARNCAPLNRVFFFRGVTADRWEMTYWCLLQFTRHCIEHLLNYTKQNNLIQQIRDIAIVDLILARHLGQFIVQFVRFFAYKCGTDVEFSSTWRFLEASECFDEEEKEAGIESTVNEIMCSLFGEQDDTWALSSSSSFHQSVFSCNLSVADIQQALVLEGVKVQTLDQSLLCDGSISVYKSSDTGKVVVEGESFKEYVTIVTIIEGLDQNQLVVDPDEMQLHQLSLQDNN